MDYAERLAKVQDDWTKLSAQQKEYESKSSRPIDLEHGIHIAKGELQATPERRAMEAAYIGWKRRVLSDKDLDIVARAGLCENFIVEDFEAMLERAIQLRSEGKSTDVIDKRIGAQLQKAMTDVADELAKLG